jgi:1-aminocyclopropane-1-carboxylate deaminase
MNADVRLDSLGFRIERKGTLKRLTEEAVAEGGRPYYFPAGVSDHPLGGLGVARWASEVRQQEVEMGLFFDCIIVCAITGSTFAGMIAGFKLLERVYNLPPRRVIGIDASVKPKETFEQALRISRSTAAKIGPKETDITPEDVILDDRYHGGCYGIPDAVTIDAIKFGAAMEGFITDSVYEGKSLAGLMDMVRKSEIWRWLERSVRSPWGPASLECLL